MKPQVKPIKISVIICAYNEEGYLGNTLTDLLKCPLAQEVIVVNDGSTDKTGEVIKSFGSQIHAISYRKNRGKGYALVKGLQAAQGKIVVFFDAHMKNLKNIHLKKLTDPIIKGKTNFILAYPGSAVGKPGKFRMIADLTGQRSYLKQMLLPYLPHLKKSRYGVETFLNEIFKPKWGKVIKLPDLIHLYKPELLAREDIIPAYIQEVLEISKTKLEINIRHHRDLQKILNPKRIKTIKTLREKAKEIKDKEVSDLIKTYVIPRVKKLTKTSDS